MASPGNFITEPNESLKCLICFGVARDPKQHEDCGKLFCKKCLKEYGKDKPCHYCKEKEPKYFKDERSKLRIPEYQDHVGYTPPKHLASLADDRIPPWAMLVSHGQCYCQSEHKTNL